GDRREQQQRGEEQRAAVEMGREEDPEQDRPGADDGADVDARGQRQQLHECAASSIAITREGRRIAGALHSTSSFPSRAFVPQTMLSPSPLPEEVPQTMLSPSWAVPQTMLSSSLATPQT